MKMEKRFFGRTKSGASAWLYILENRSGMQLAVSDYGATIVSVCVPDKNGEKIDVVRGYDDVSGYEAGELYFGACVGRNANRIGGAGLKIAGIKYAFGKNDGRNNLHSGPDIYSRRFWQADAGDSCIVFRLKSPHLDQGFPGNAEIQVAYSLTDENEVRIRYEAQADADTVFNMTNHSYFNMNGSGSVLDHEVVIHADSFTPTDSGSIPTGEIAPVEGTPMDFRTAKKIGAEIGADYEPLRLAKGYDHNYVLDGNGFREAAQFYSAESRIRMHVYTDLPGLQFYTANYVEGEKGKKGEIYNPRCAACFETQYFPDAPHHENFPCTVFHRGTEYKTETVYRFETAG